MPSQTWVQCVQTLPGAGATQTSGGPTSLFTNGVGLYSFIPNFFWYVGQAFRMRAIGILTTSATANNLTLSLYFGAVIVATTTAIALSTSVLAGYVWELEFLGTIRTLGNGTNSTNAYGGRLSGGGGTIPNYTIPVPAGASATFVSAGWDNTVSEQAILECTLSGTNDSITLEQYFLEAMN